MLCDQSVKCISYCETHSGNLPCDTKLSLALLTIAAMLITIIAIKIVSCVYHCMGDHQYEYKVSCTYNTYIKLIRLVAIYSIIVSDCHADALMIIVILL